MNKVVIKGLYDSKMHKKFFLFHMFRRSFSIYFTLLLAAFVTYIAIKQTLANPNDTTTIIAVWVLTAATLVFTPGIMLFRISSATKKEAK